MRRWVVQLLLVVLLVVVERAGCLTTLSTERAHILSTYKQLVTSRSARQHQLFSMKIAGVLYPREGICHGVINIQIPNAFHPREGICHGVIHIPNQFVHLSASL
jgi:hypothetical protein